MSSGRAVAMFDEVHDAQRLYREILDAVARPGSLRRLHGVPPHPAEFAEAAAAVALTLLDGSVTRATAGYSGEVGAWLQAKTRCPEAGAADADFLFLGDAASRPELLATAQAGDPLYPETGATAVIQLVRLEAEPFEGALRMRLTGPGVEGFATLYAGGLDAVTLATLAHRNAEYPLGIDVLFVCGDRVAAVPRSVRVEWEQ